MNDAEQRVARACELRAARAELLAGKFEAAAEPLRFAAGLYRAQASARLSADFASAVAAALPVIEFVARAGPPALAADARDFSRDRLSAYWGGLSEFDFLGPCMDWKLDWEPALRTHSWLTIFRPTRRGRLVHEALITIHPLGEP